MDCRNAHTQKSFSTHLLHSGMLELHFCITITVSVLRFAYPFVVVYLFSDQESQQRSCGDSTSGLTEPHLSCGASQETDEIDTTKKKLKNQTRFGIKAQNKDHSDRKGNVKRPDSPYHISSMMLYQKGGAKGLTVCKNEDEQELKGPATHTENDLSSCDVRAKWFLSTNHWQGCIPLPGVDLTSENRKLCDNVTDSGEMSPAVSESLEKMKDNYSLFYKIACDISISDTDITKNDGQASLGPEDKDQLIITEAGEDTTQESNQEDKKIPKDLTPEMQDKSASDTSASPAKEDHGTPQNGNGDITCQEDLKLRGSLLRPSVQVTDGDHSLDEKAGLGEEKDSKAQELKGSSSLSAEHKGKVQERDFPVTRPSSACETASVTRSNSLGKARVTVLRTSF